jgi:hypothetical protein
MTGTYYAGIAIVALGGILKGLSEVSPWAIPRQSQGRSQGRSKELWLYPGSWPLLGRPSIGCDASPLRGRIWRSSPSHTISQHTLKDRLRVLVDHERSVDLTSNLLQSRCAMDLQRSPWAIVPREGPHSPTLFCGRCVQISSAGPMLNAFLTPLEYQV